MSVASPRDAVERYLRQVADRLNGISGDEQAEILAGLRDHIEDALASRREEPGAVEAILGQLGPPDLIAEEARRTLRPPVAAFTPLDFGVIAAVAIAGVLPWFAGWLVAAALIWYSPNWRPRDKSLGVYVPLAAAVGSFIAVAVLARWYVVGILPYTAFEVALPVASLSVLLVTARVRPRSLATVGLVVGLTILWLGPVVNLLVPFHVNAQNADMGEASGQCTRIDTTVKPALGLGESARISFGVCNRSDGVHLVWGPDCHDVGFHYVEVHVTCRNDAVDGAPIISAQLSSVAVTGPWAAVSDTISVHSSTTGLAGVEGPGFGWRDRAETFGLFALWAVGLTLSLFVVRLWAPSGWR